MSILSWVLLLGGLLTVGFLVFVKNATAPVMEETHTVGVNKASDFVAELELENGAKALRAGDSRLTLSYTVLKGPDSAYRLFLRDDGEVHEYFFDSRQFDQPFEWNDFIVIVKSADDSRAHVEVRK